MAFLCAAGAELDRYAAQGRPSTDVIDATASLVAHLIINSSGAVAGKRARFLQLLDDYLAEAEATAKPCCRSVMSRLDRQRKPGPSRIAEVTAECCHTTANGGFLHAL
jgi:hypothetical protein